MRAWRRQRQGRHAHQVLSRVQRRAQSRDPATKSGRNQPSPMWLGTISHIPSHLAPNHTFDRPLLPTIDQTFSHPQASEIQVSYPWSLCFLPHPRLAPPAISADHVLRCRRCAPPHCGTSPSENLKGPGGARRLPRFGRSGVQRYARGSSRRAAAESVIKLAHGCSVAPCVPSANGDTHRTLMFIDSLHSSSIPPRLLVLGSPRHTASAATLFVVAGKSHSDARTAASRRQHPCRRGGRAAPQQG